MQQPWWQNALDTYTTGARIDPQISGTAAFNMTIFLGSYYAPFGLNQNFGWQYFYGGTSFATPTSAGEWALIEEQANVAFGTPKMGDINPTLFAAHNAYEAGVSSFSQSPFIDMSNIGTGYDWAPSNGFAAYYNNLSINQPSDQILPVWYATLFNPAGQGWNYLQGLGMINVATMDSELIGQVPSTQHALMNEPFQIMQVTSSGALAPITELQNGTTYTLQVVLANGQSGGHYTVSAYSGGANDGTYGGSILTVLQTNSTGQFTYTPMYATPSVTSGVPTGGSEYGYFKVVSLGSTDWAFQPFAVEPAPATGTLLLGVPNAYGELETSVAEVPMFTTGTTGFFNDYGLGQVFLNGNPVAGAVVTETAVNVSQPDAGVNTLAIVGESYAPGTTLGQFLSDARGNVNFWTDAFIAETSGMLQTQVVELQASYLGLTSNPVIVYIEPQSGSFNANVALNSAGNALVGYVTFNDMKYVNYVNISIGNMPGQYVNYTFASETSYNGIIPINFTNLPPPGTPIQLNMLAEGQNILTFSESFFGFTFTYFDEQNPIYWFDPITITNPGSTPVASIASSAYPVANGTITLSFAGNWESTGAIGYLNISYGNTVTQIGVFSALTGSIAFNTSNFADGFYTLTYTVVTPTGLHASSSVVIYIDNTEAQLNAEILTLQSELSAANAKIAVLQTDLSSDNATIASMQAQITSLNTQIGNLTTQLNAEMAKYNATEAQLLSAEATISADQSTITSLKAQLSADNSTIASQASTISSLQNEVNTLQKELNAKKDYVAPAWYDIFGGAGIGILALILVVSGLVGFFAARTRKESRKEKKTGNPADSQ
ncbi:MAG: hypothetical protein M1113_02660 [Candidatus Thermoplasmatota archaeon]|nr:hypothetical protein [Candidatus Thermoplasmatota archaeon]